MDAQALLVAGMKPDGTKCVAILAPAQEIIEAWWPTLMPGETLLPIVAKLRRWRGREQVVRSILADGFARANVHFA